MAINKYLDTESLRAIKTYVEESTSSATNIQNGTGTYSLKQKETETGIHPPANTSSGEASVAFGYRSTASNVAAMALGEGAEATGRNSFASNEMTQAIGRGSHAEGKVTYARGMYTHAEGSETSAGFNDQTVGMVWGDQASHAEGYQTIALDRYTHAEGYDTLAGHEGTPKIDLPNNPQTENFQYAEGAHAEGYQTKATNAGAHSEGVGTKASGYASHAGGFQTIAGYSSQTVVGKYNDNKEKTLFEVGCGTSSSAKSNAFEVYRDGHAELKTQGTGDNAVVLKKSVTTDLVKGGGARSVIQIHVSQANTASGQSAIALGMGCQATATRSVAIGDNLISNKSNMTAVGKYNDQTIANTLFVVGNGSSTTRSNALSVFSDGHVEIGLMGSTNKSVTTKQYVDNSLNGVVKDNLTFTNNLKVYDKDGVDISSQSFADPTVWDGEDGYFYATHTGIDSPIYRSNDLVTWRYSQSGIISSEAKTTITTWGYKNLWAPQVKKINGKFILYAAAVNEDVSPKKYAIVALSSTIPNGPFQDPVVITTTASSGVGNAIDPYVIRGRDDNLYLFFGSSYGIYYTKLTYDGLSLVKGATFTHIAGQTITQSPNRENVYEGVYIYYNTDYYYMFVSAGHAGTSNYCIKVGRSTSLFGPFKDSNGVDLLNGGGDLILSGTNNNANGPGHNGEIFVDSKGKTYMFYHCHITASPSTHSGQTLNWVRPLFLQEIKWDSNYWPYFDNSGKPQLTNNIIPYLPHTSNDGIGQCLTYPKMYNHALHIIDNNSSPKMDIFVTLVSINGNSLAKASFIKWLYNYGYTSNNRVLCVTGSFGAIGTNYVVGVFSSDGTNLKISYIPNGSISRTSADVNPSAFADTVTPLIN